MTMRYFVLLLFLTVCNGFAQSKDCSKFRTGTFKYVNSDEQDTVIVRNDSVQIETDATNGFKLTGSLKWLSDCKYTLTYTDVSNPDYSFIVGTIFNVDITSTTKNAYKYTAYNETRKITGEIIKIE